MELFEYIDVLNKPHEIYMEKIYRLPFSVERHWHYYGEILYVEKGQIQVKCEEKEYVLQVGDLILIAPQSVHEIVAIGDAPIRYAVLKFDPNGLHVPGIYYGRLWETLEKISVDGAIVFTKTRLEATPIREILLNCTREQEKGEFGFDYVAQASLGMLMIYLSRLLPQQSPSGKKREKQKPRYYFHEALTYIEHNYSQNIKVEELAKRSGMSYSNFAKLFKKQFGRSCKEYLEYVRINKAEELVLYSDWDLSYIAQETGFADCSHMIRTYKKFKKETPKQARIREAKRDED